MKALPLILALLLAGPLAAQSEEELVREAVEKYIEGSSYNREQVFLDAFYEDARMFLSHPEREIWVLSPQEYAAPFADRSPGEYNGRKGNILDVDVENDIATAKAEIFLPNADRRYVDLFLLKKLGGEWKILSKAATSEPLP